MNPNTKPQFGQAELEASLKRLGIKELEERMEVSPLLTDPGIEHDYAAVEPRSPGIGMRRSGRRSVTTTKRSASMAWGWRFARPGPAEAGSATSAPAST